MWIFTPIGFFSAVRKPGDTDLTIRARVRTDLDALRGEYLPELGPTIDHAGSDYPYRARVAPEAWGRALATMGERIAYSNFKDQVAHAQGHARAKAYGRVWSVLYELEAREGKK